MICGWLWFDGGGQCCGVLILWYFSGSGGDGFGGFFMFFMFKICVKGETDKFQFLILFTLHFVLFFVLGGERYKM